MIDLSILLIWAHQIAKKLAFIVAVGSVFPVVVMPQAPVGSKSPVVSGVGQRLDRVVERATALGFAGEVLVAVDDSVVLRRGYGRADRSTGRAFTAATPSGIGSVSKLFAAVAILRLVDEKRLRLDDQLGTLLSDVPAQLANITVHQLLTHTSGLPGGYLDPRADTSMARAVTHALGVSRSSERIGTWHYSSEGFLLLAAIVESRSGMPYGRFVHEDLLSPLGMINTTVQGTDPEALDEAHSYVGLTDHGSSGAVEVDWRAVGAGDIVSTADDLYRFATAIRHNQLLSDSSSRLMKHAHVVITDGYGAGYGTFVRTAGTPLRSGVEHGGDDLEGYSAFVGIYDDPNATMIILANARDHEGRWLRGLVGEDLERVLAGQPTAADSLPSLTKPEASLRNQLAGHWQSVDGAVSVELISTGGDLFLIPTSQTAIALLEGEAMPRSDSANRLVTQVMDGLMSRRGAAAFQPVTEAGDSTSRQSLGLWWAGWRTKLPGAPIGWQVLGTRRQGNGLWTSVRVDLANGWRVFRLKFPIEGALTLQQLQPDRVSPHVDMLTVVQIHGGALLAVAPFDGEQVLLRLESGFLSMMGPDGKVLASLRRTSSNTRNSR